MAHTICNLIPFKINTKIMYDIDYKLVYNYMCLSLKITNNFLYRIK